MAILSHTFVKVPLIFVGCCAAIGVSSGGDTHLASSSAVFAVKVYAVTAGAVAGALPDFPAAFNGARGTVAPATGNGTTTTGK